MYDNSNVFAKILRGEIPAKKIYEDEFLIAIEDIEPAAPVHVLIVPKGEFTSFDDFATHASPELQAHFFGKIAEISRKMQVHETGYRLITNHGKDASQTVAHFHMHLLGGKPMGKLLG